MMGAFLILDGPIIRRFAIKEAEKSLGKKVDIRRVTIHYIPTLSLTLYDIKIPNPDMNNYLLTASRVHLTATWPELFKNTLFLPTIELDNAHFLDSRTQPSPFPHSSSPTASSTNDSAKNPTQNTDTINAQLAELDTSIAALEKQREQQKKSIIDGYNTLLDKAKKLPAPDLSSLKAFQQSTKQYSTLIADSSALQKEVKAFRNLHDSNAAFIKAHKQTIYRSLDTETAAILSQIDKKGVSSTFKDTLTAYIEQLKQSTPFDSIATDRIVFTNTFIARLDDVESTLFISRLTVNTPTSSIYLYGENLSKYRQNNHALYALLTMTNHELIQESRISINATTDTRYTINGYANQITIPTFTIYETPNTTLLFKTNTTNYFLVDGQLSATSHVTLIGAIPSPIYTTAGQRKNLITLLAPALSKKPIDATVLLTGPYDNLDVSVSTSLDGLINRSRNSLLKKSTTDHASKKRKALDKLFKEKERSFEDKFQQDNRAISASQDTANRTIETQNPGAPPASKELKKASDALNNVFESLF